MDLICRKRTPNKKGPHPCDIYSIVIPWAM
jgi:hypothetical protein